MTLLLVMPWMAGTWYPTVPATDLKDINGVQVNVGDTVYIKATVTQLLPSTPYIGNAVLAPRYGPPVVINVSTLNLTH